ncbi:glutamate formimidoyltransferase [Natranaerobius thermophilus]|uniref:glutamate formimidoyltransferase n=1 Tax=Natranaerobius thermophilus (strain ATCC BAA-1301 / DSM 18059 / JW/NM-WN-LF) TaxID=457570 RepID=B2A3D7_NATTJ|nr:glutamate formimidoyltransferase [Natranaerobius thermophilus]ACB86366.1 glutamate formiminotransferase [Natranaerobius thermophilus JW/NM-WN-LF]
MALIECVPNYSEGRDKAIIEKIESHFKDKEGIKLLDTAPDEDHNRTVITVVGEPEPLVEAVIASAKTAHEEIDMTKHQGEHPRMGATDVIPLTPVKDISMEECVELSKDIAKRLGEDLDIPVFMYEESATRKDRKNLAKVRKGEYEGVKKRINEEGEEPDYGPAKMHETAGATAVGARKPLVAYNVNLSTSDVDIAKKIAKNIRQRSGGLKNVKALGIYLDDRQVAQVTMNLVDVNQTPIYRVQELIKIEAARYGVYITDCEIVGLTPVEALIDVARYYLQLDGFDSEQVLENRLID